MMLLHADLFVASMARSLELYVDQLGFQIVEDMIVESDLVRFLSEDHYDAMRLVLLKVAPMGSWIELQEFQATSMRKATPYLPPPHAGSLTVMVDDLQDRLQRLRRAGVAVDGDLFTIDLPRLGRARIGFLRDPDGHRIELLERLDPALPAS
jgi:catechol 2,3-dioxygenase-like lactoylglutathione lyase family enzyme